MIIERPHPDEAGELTKILLASKKHWNYPTEWLDLWADELSVTPEAIRSRDFYVGRNEEQIVFVYSVRQMHGSEYELEDCWVAPQYIGHGYGRILFEHLQTTLQTLGCSKLTILSDPHAEGFYRKMGAVRVGEQPSQLQGRSLPILEYTP